MTISVLYAEPLPADLASVVKDALGPGVVLTIVTSKDRDALLRLVAASEVVVVATTRVDDALLAAAPQLKLVQHQGVGYDNIDVSACCERGVRVALTPEGTTTGVDEHFFLLLFSLC